MPLSNQARAAAYAQETGAEWVTLLVISHPDLASPIRVCDGGENVTSNTELYQAFPFRLERPTDTDDAPPQARLVIGNVDRRVVEAVRGISGDISVAFSVVLASQPDVVEEGPVHLILRNVEYDDTTVQGDLLPEPILSEPCPPDSYTPSRNPALFRGTIGT